MLGARKAIRQAMIARKMSLRGLLRNFGRDPTRDAVPMMPWSGLLPIHIEHATEMGASELHLGPHHVGGPALTTDRSMPPGQSRTKAGEGEGAPAEDCGQGGAGGPEQRVQLGFQLHASGACEEGGPSVGQQASRSGRGQQIRVGGQPVDAGPGQEARHNQEAADKVGNRDQGREESAEREAEALGKSRKAHRVLDLGPAFDRQLAADHDTEGQPADVLGEAVVEARQERQVKPLWRGEKVLRHVSLASFLHRISRSIRCRSTLRGKPVPAAYAPGFR